MLFKPEGKRSFAVITGLCFGSFCGAFQSVVSMSCRYPHAALLMKGFTSGPVVSRQPNSLYSTPTDGMNGGRHSYVEGSTYDSRLAEIEAMGGDPFFLEDDDQETVQMDEKRSPVPPQKLDVNEVLDQARKNTATNGMGPSKKVDKTAVKQNESDWEWDGIVDEDAHLDF